MKPSLRVVSDAPDAPDERKKLFVELARGDHNIPETLGLTVLHERVLPYAKALAKLNDVTCRDYDSFGAAITPRAQDFEKCVTDLIIKHNKHNTPIRHMWHFHFSIIKAALDLKPGPDFTFK